MGNIISWICWWFSPCTPIAPLITVLHVLVVKKVIILEHARNLTIRGRRNLIVP
ncbi:hypothetical protein L873DRAFT_1820249 [Choiromyces venosus 120613-1]|uniref:Uncharacterized protein n=1 Tax=Choiromyces venosus 120613-1 TaxID=1336337 RepID=A0A3N4IXP8_9PEZI|nr:hypothetical protein L873DRAFT_1820249 [Choiromyces venosus 120613-1]